MLLGILPSVPGFLQTIGVLSNIAPLFSSLYDVAWFVGVFVSTVAYAILMKYSAAADGLPVSP